MAGDLSVCLWKSISGLPSAAIETACWTWQESNIHEKTLQSFNHYGNKQWKALKIHTRLCFAKTPMRLWKKPEIETHPTKASLPQHTVFKQCLCSWQMKKTLRLIDSGKWEEEVSKEKAAKRSSRCNIRKQGRCLCTLVLKCNTDFSWKWQKQQLVHLHQMCPNVSRRGTHLIRSRHSQGFCECSNVRGWMRIESSH